MFAAALLILLTGSALAQRDPRSSQQDYADCQQSDDLARGIAACTRIGGASEQSAADRAVAYRWLGNDHLATGALDQAIADYSNAIRFDPQSATTYVSRAIANSQKGDRMAAIADYRQAVVIDPARVGGMADGTAELRTIAQAAAELLAPVVEIAPTGSASKTGFALGFVIDSSGLVVTLRDAVGDAKNVTLSLNDSTRLDASVVGTDARTNLALLKLNTDRRLNALRFGDSSKVTVGQRLAGFANASAAEDLLKLGAVTALDQSLNLGPYDKFIAIDLAIGGPTSEQPVIGSGGPIFNAIGEVVGIHVGTKAGKVFANPAADVVPVIDQLRQYGTVRRGWVGVRIQQVTDDIAEILNIKPPHGALVASVDDNGPANLAGIESGDVVVKFDGHDIKEMHDLPRIVADTPVSKEVDVVVIRNGKEETHKVKIGRLEDGEKLAAAEAKKGSTGPEEKSVVQKTLGLELSSLSDDLRKKFRIRDNIKGVVVTGVDASVAAAAPDKRLSPGDVIVEVQYQSVGNPSDLQARLDQLKVQGKKVAVLLVANADGETRFVALGLQ